MDDANTAKVNKCVRNDFESESIGISSTEKTAVYHRFSITYEFLGAASGRTDEREPGYLRRNKIDLKSQPDWSVGVIEITILSKTQPKIRNFAGLPTPAFSANYNATIERLKLLHLQLLFCLTVFSDTR